MTELTEKISDLNLKIIISGLLLALLIALTSEYLLIGILILVIVSGLLFFSSNVSLFLIIISLLSITVEFFANLRMIITLISIGLLGYLFIKRYGLKIKKYPTLPIELSWYIIMLFFTLGVATVFSDFFFVSFFATTRLLIFLFLSYLFFSLIKNEETIFYYIYALFILLLVVGVRMIIDLVNIGVQVYFQRIFISSIVDLKGSLGYTGHTTFFITSSLITAMFFMKKFNKIKSKLILSLLLLFNIFVLIFANSRGGILAAILSSLFILLVINKKVVVKIGFFILVVVTILFLTFPTINEVVTVYLRMDTVGDREIYWKTGIEAIQESPLFGLGPDTFDRNFFNYAPSRIIKFYSPGTAIQGKPHPHNFFLYFTAENGILGLISSIFFFIIFFGLALRTIKLTQNRNKDYFILSIAITGIGIGIFFRSFIEVTGYLTYGFISRDLPFWLMFGILLSIYNQFNQESGSKALGYLKFKLKS